MPTTVFPNSTRVLLLIVIMAALIAIVACGGDAEDEATVAPAATTAPTAMPEATVAAPAQATAVPTAMPEATEEAAAPAPAGPEGTLNIAFKELFAFGNAPRLTESAVLVFVGSSSGESMIKLNIDREMVPQLAAEWSVDDSGSVWTIKLQENVEFHKDWGNFTAADVVYTMNEYTAPEGITSWLGTLQRLFGAEGGGPTVVDDHTVSIDTVTPQFDFLYALILPEVIQTVSKSQLRSRRTGRCHAPGHRHGSMGVRGGQHPGILEVQRGKRPLPQEPGIHRIGALGHSRGGHPGGQFRDRPA